MVDAARDLRALFESNRRWADGIRDADPDFFDRLAHQQSPQYLWIGCSDSRVPANQIVGLLPGELFVHRNIANLVVHTDLNCLSVLQFAVDRLGVKHVIVCGHYGCGGVQAVLRRERLGLADNWLRHVEDVRDRHFTALTAIDDERDRHARLCELNVIEQVANVCRTTIVEEAWSRGRDLAIHGWIYAVEDGRLRDLCATVTAPGEVEPILHEAYARRPVLHP
jgi:carbonic anhydrase